MLSWMRSTISRKGGLVALLLTLFVMIPSLEAAACAADNCYNAATEQTLSGDDGEQSDRGQTDHKSCASSCHCSHIAANPVQDIASAFTACSQGIVQWPSSDDAAPNAPNSLDRPPRT
jgi:hypothetical protein